MFDIGFWELVVIGVVAFIVLVFLFLLADLRVFTHFLQRAVQHTVVE